MGKNDDDADADADACVVVVVAVEEEEEEEEADEEEVTTALKSDADWGVKNVDARNALRKSILDTR